MYRKLLALTAVFLVLNAKAPDFTWSYSGNDEVPGDHFRLYFAAANNPSSTPAFVGVPITERVASVSSEFLSNNTVYSFWMVTVGVGTNALTSLPSNLVQLKTDDSGGYAPVELPPISGLVVQSITPVE